MVADLERKIERRRFERRSGSDRRATGRQRRSSDRDELVSVTDEDVVQLRMGGITHSVQPGPEAVIPFDQDPPPQRRLLQRWWDRIRGLG